MRLKHATPRPTDLRTLILRGLVHDLKPRPSSSAMFKAIEALAPQPGQRVTTRQLTGGAMDRAADRLSAARRPANSIRSVLAHVHQLWAYAWRLGLTEHAPPDEPPPQAGRSPAHRPPDPTRQQIVERAAELHAGWSEEERRKKLGAAAR